MTAIDYYRDLVFPNAIRRFRKQFNIGSLLELSDRVPGITYIRLSKIERGEIFARADELREIAIALGVDAAQLLVDIDDPAFDIAAWAETVQGTTPTDPEAERIAVLLAAALRSRRGGDPSLTIAKIEAEYGIAPVMLSRIENALKPLDRWNADVRASLCRLFEVVDEAELVDHLETLLTQGKLDAALPMVANPELRIAKSRGRIAALKQELGIAQDAAPARSDVPADASPVVPPTPAPIDDGLTAHAIVGGEPLPLRLVPVFGTPLPNGLIARVPTGGQVEAPVCAGPRAFGLRLGRPTLGAGLPGRAILVVDPDRFPSIGGLAVVDEGDGLRALSVAADRHGRMMGYSERPDIAIALDGIDPSKVAAVLSALFE